MTIEIPDELVKDLEPVMAARKATLAELALQSLEALRPARLTTSEAIAIWQSLPHAGDDAVDELERAIEEGKLPSRQSGIFDDLRS